MGSGMSRSRARDWWERIGESGYFIYAQVGERWADERAEEYLAHYRYLESLEEDENYDQVRM